MSKCAVKQSLSLQISILLLFLASTSPLQSCKSGYFSNNSECLKCDQSCKTCTSAESCSTCEDFMFLNSTSQLCTFCDYGDYYDHSARTCRNCNGSCYGYCQYQSECYQCESDEMLDVDTLTCVKVCEYPKIVLHDPQFTISSLCRGSEFYVNPSSSSILELGTHDHPYHTMRAVMSEILNHHSNMDRNLTIYLKEGEVIYIEDETNYVMNITSLTITSYSDENATSGRATLIPTEIPQSTVSKKAAFSILASTDLKLKQVITEGGYTAEERSTLTIGQVTILVLRSSIYIDNVDFVREYIDYGKETHVVYLVYLQHKSCEITNVDFNVTGTLVGGSDPFNGKFENITVDAYGLFNGFWFLVDCNYPEASLENEVVFLSITVVTSSERTLATTPNIICYQGPGNYTARDCDFIDFYSTLADSKSTLTLYKNSLCQPADDIKQSIIFDNITTSLIDNPTPETKMQVIVIYSDFNLYRLFKIYILNQHYENLENNAGPAFLMVGSVTDETYLTNCTISNYYGGSYPVFQLAINGQLHLENILFEAGEALVYPCLSLSYILQSLTIKNLTVSDWNIDASATGTLISLINFETTYTSVEGLSIINSSLYKMSALSNSVLLQQLIIRNCNFRNTSLGSATHLISTGEVKSIIFENNSAVGLKNSDSINYKNSILYVNSLNLNSTLNSEILNNTIEDSHLSFLSFGSFTSSATTTKEILISNLSFTNTEFDQNRDLVSTSGIEQSGDITLSMNQILFSGITFKNRGTLLNLQHQLPNAVSLIDSTFSNLTGARIIVESANKQNTNQITRVQINSTTFDSINDRYNSLVLVNQGGWLEINNCTFSNIVSYEEGSVIKAGTKKTTTVIRDSLFQNNTALQGGVFSVAEESAIRVYDTEITQNFASVSGVIRVINNGYFEFYNTKIYQNYASQSPISELFDSASVSIISGCTIYDNVALSLSQITSEFNRCSKLCFVPDSFVEFTSPGLPETASEEYFSKTSHSLFQLISGTQSSSLLSSSDYQSASLQSTLRIEDGTVISSQGSLLYLFLASTSIINSKISSLTLTEHPIRVASSRLFLQNVTFSGIDAADSFYLIFTLQDSALYVKDCVFMNMHSGVVSSRSTQLMIEFANIQEVYATDQLVQISSCDSVNLTGVSVSSSSSSQASLVYITGSSAVSIRKFEAIGINKTALMILSSTVSSIQDSIVSQCSKAIYCKDSIIEEISKITLENNGGVDNRFGGAIEIQDCMASIQNSTFRDNIAMLGGAIHFGCISTSMCNLTIHNSTFEANTGVEQGGAINYDYVRPIFIDNVYVNNTAPYGHNIASYPVKIAILGHESEPIYLANVGSGILYQETLELGLYDYDGQVMVLESENPVVIKSIDSQNSKIRGTTSVLFEQGEAQFDSLYFYTSPGEPSVLFQATSSAIDTVKIKNVFGRQISDNIIDVNFRFCKPGEIIVDDHCEGCSAGTYALDWNATECTSCMDHAVCNGNTEISIKSGYWRRTTNSTKIVECLNEDACKGGYISQNANPVECASGYEGNLCTKCQVTDDSKYQEVSSYLCEKCPDPALNAIRVVGVGLLVFMFFMTIIIINIRKKKDSQVSILLRILTNYLQLLSSSLSFRVSFPDALVEIFVPVERVGASSTTFLSFDCFVTDIEITGPFPSNAFLKLFLTSLLPIILFCVVIAIWVSLRLISQRIVPDLRRSIFISLISILFLLHPTLARQSLSIFQCVEIDDGVSKVRIDTDMDCYSSEHLMWCFLIGLPTLVIWVIIPPITGLVLLAKNINQGDDNKIKQYMLILYQGLKKKSFYWEFMNSVTKVIILTAFTLLVTFEPFYRLMTAIIVLLAVFRLQLYIKPYKIKENNKIEILALLAGTLTLFSGMVFSNSDNQQPVLNTFIFVFVILVNAIFITQWIFLFVQCMSEHYAAFRLLHSILRILFCKNCKQVLLQSQEVHNSKAISKKKHKKLMNNLKLIPRRSSKKHLHKSRVSAIHKRHKHHRKEPESSTELAKKAHHNRKNSDEFDYFRQMSMFHRQESPSKPLSKSNSQNNDHEIPISSQQEDSVDHTVNIKVVDPKNKHKARKFY